MNYVLVKTTELNTYYLAKKTSLKNLSGVHNSIIVLGHKL